MEALKFDPAISVYDSEIYKPKNHDISKMALIHNQLEVFKKNLIEEDIIESWNNHWKRQLNELDLENDPRFNY
jgi:hypothetical protein